MLHAPPFEGTMKVRNKGVDFALLADAETAPLAMAASRRLSVCGISTAVLEETALPEADVRTLQYYGGIVRCMAAMNERVMQAVRGKTGCPLYRFDGEGEAALIAAARRMLRETGGIPE